MQYYNHLVEALIRPERARYVVDELGASRFKGTHGYYKRKDLNLVNGRNMMIACSYFYPVRAKSKDLDRSNSPSSSPSSSSPSSSPTVSKSNSKLKNSKSEDEYSKTFPNSNEVDELNEPSINSPTNKITQPSITTTLHSTSDSTSPEKTVLSKNDLEETYKNGELSKEEENSLEFPNLKSVSSPNLNSNSQIHKEENNNHTTTTTTSQINHTISSPTLSIHASPSSTRRIKNAQRQEVSDMEGHPCVIYLHGNSGCRLDALETLEHICAYNIALFAFDFSGSGMSHGDYVSLGYWERDDLEIIIRFLKEGLHCPTIGLWGRSMGAATALMVRPELRDNIDTLILDSPFASLEDLAYDVAQTENIPVTFLNWGASVALNFIRKSILTRADFDIMQVRPINHASGWKVPALFIHSDRDELISPEHSVQLFETYGGSDKKLIYAPGLHNSVRPARCQNEFSSFISKYLLKDGRPMTTICPSIPLRGEQGRGAFWGRITEDDRVSFLNSTVVIVIDSEKISFCKPFTMIVLHRFSIDSLRVFRFTTQTILFRFKGKRATLFYCVEGEDIGSILLRTTDLFVEIGERSLDHRCILWREDSRFYTESPQFN